MEPKNSAADTALAAIIRQQMSGADETSIEVVTAMAGLLARVAYADRSYHDLEQARVREELSMVLGFSDSQIDAIGTALRADIQALGSGPTRQFSNVLRGQLDDHMRADTVKALLELAFADRVLRDTELSLIRRIGHELEVDAMLVERLIDHLRSQTSAD